jgi:thiamine kinase-like enzyme
MLKNIDWNLICNAVPVRFHGDFILDNILYTDKDDFVLLDWRQDFGGNIDAGDKYYDLAKLNHNLTINHDMLSNDHYYVKSTPTGMYCDIFRSHNMVQCQQAFFKSIEAMNYDKQKINLMTSLIWINMSPLHEYPLNKFLFYFGKYNLWRNLND